MIYRIKDRRDNIYRQKLKFLVLKLTKTVLYDRVMTVIKSYVRVIEIDQEV